MGEFTQHNWRPLEQQVFVGKTTLRNGGDRRRYLTAYTRRCTRCGVVATRPGLQGAVWIEGTGLVPVELIDERGRAIAARCTGRPAAKGL